MQRPNRVEHAYDLIGATPVVRLNRLVPQGSATIYLKLENANPGGSVKDRIALGMIQEAETRGALRPGMKLLEATSGNTGIGLAFVAAGKGYPITLVMPDTMTVERRALLKAYGIELSGKGLVMDPVLRADENKAELKLTMGEAVLDIRYSKPAGFRRAKDSPLSVSFDGRALEGNVIALPLSPGSHTLSVEFA